MRRLKFAAVALAAVIALAGCGGGSDSTGSTSSHNTYSESKTYEDSGSTYGIASAMGSESDTMDEEYSGENGEASGDDGSILRKQEDQKIVYTGEMEIQTLDYDKSVADIKQKIREMGGFSEYEKENDYDYGWYDYEPDSYRKDKNRTLNITARIPSDNFEAFMAVVGETGKVMNKSVRAENISQVYAETETYKLALEKEQARLLQMMDKAETIEEMIAVESRLSEVEHQLSMYKTDLAAMDKDVEYSTISIEIEEVVRYSETKTGTTFRERLANAFTESIAGFILFCQELILMIVRVFPFIIIIGIIIAVAVKSSKKNNKKKRELYEKQRKKIETASMEYVGNKSATGEFSVEEPYEKQRSEIYEERKRVPKKAPKKETVSVEHVENKPVMGEFVVGEPPHKEDKKENGQ